MILFRIWSLLLRLIDQSAGAYLFHVFEGMQIPAPILL